MATRKVEIRRTGDDTFEVQSSRDATLFHRVQINEAKHTGICSCPGDGSIERAGTATICRHVKAVYKMVNATKPDAEKITPTAATALAKIEPAQLAPRLNDLPARDEMRAMMELSNFLVGGAMLPKGITKPQDVMMILMYGRAVGIDPMTATQKLFVVDGKIGMYAELMLAIAKANDPTIDARFSWGDADGGSCTCELWRGGKKVQTVTYTFAMAQTSGAGKKQGPWQTYRRDMLAWNACKRALRLGAPDAYLAVTPKGIASVVQTFEDDIVEGSAVVIEDEADIDPLPAPAATPPGSNMGHTAANPGGLASESTETPPAAVEPARAPDHADRVTELRGLLKLASTKLKPEEFDGLKDAMKAAYPSAMGRGPDGVVRFGPSNLSSDELTEAIADITRILAPTPAASEAAQPTEAAVVDPDDLPFE